MKPQQNNVMVLGSSGAGKSLIFGAYYLVDEVLPYGCETVFTNFPLGLVPGSHSSPPTFEGEWFLDRIFAATAAKYGGRAEDFQCRVRLLDEEVLQEWRDFKGGPWDLDELRDAYLILDEVGVYAHRSAPVPHRKAWSNYLGDARHRNVRNLLITQNAKKVATEVMVECGERWLLSDRAGDRDPWLKFAYGDMQQLVAKFTGERVGHTKVIQEINPGGGRWDKVSEEMIRRSPSYFALYNSFSTPDSGKGSGSSREDVYKRLGWFRLVFWFFQRNPKTVWRLALGVLMMCVAVWFLMNPMDHLSNANRGVRERFFGSRDEVKSVVVEAKAVEKSVPEKGAAEVREPVVRGSVGKRVFLKGTK